MTEAEQKWIAYRKALQAQFIADNPTIEDKNECFNSKLPRSAVTISGAYMELYNNRPDSPGAGSPIGHSSSLNVI